MAYLREYLGNLPSHSLLLTKGKILNCGSGSLFMVTQWGAFVRGAIVRIFTLSHSVLLLFSGRKLNTTFSFWCTFYTIDRHTIVNFFPLQVQMFT